MIQWSQQRHQGCLLFDGMTDAADGVPDGPHSAADCTVHSADDSGGYISCASNDPSVHEVGCVQVQGWRISIVIAALQFKF